MQVVETSWLVEKKPYRDFYNWKCDDVLIDRPLLFLVAPKFAKNCAVGFQISETALVNNHAFFQNIHVIKIGEQVQTMQGAHDGFSFAFFKHLLINLYFG